MAPFLQYNILLIIWPTLQKFINMLLGAAGLPSCYMIGSTDNCKPRRVSHGGWTISISRPSILGRKSLMLATISPIMLNPRTTNAMSKLTLSQAEKSASVITDKVVAAELTEDSYTSALSAVVMPTMPLTMSAATQKT